MSTLLHSKEEYYICAIFVTKPDWQEHESNSYHYTGSTEAEAIEELSRAISKLKSLGFIIKKVRINYELSKTDEYTESDIMGRVGKIGEHSGT